MVWTFLNHVFSQGFPHRWTVLGGVWLWFIEGWEFFDPPSRRQGHSVKPNESNQWPSTFWGFEPGYLQVSWCSLKGMAYYMMLIYIDFGSHSSWQTFQKIRRRHLRSSFQDIPSGIDPQKMVEPIRMGLITRCSRLINIVLSPVVSLLGKPFKSTTKSRPV